MDEIARCTNCGVEQADSICGHSDDHTGLRVWWCSPRCMEQPKQRTPLLLIRGLPGSGKTTMARSRSYRALYPVHLEADMYHMVDGVYLYTPELAAAAHRWCLETTRIMLNNGKRVVVSNTFVTLAEIEPYMELGFELSIVKAPGAWASIHNVPPNVLEYMQARWEELP